MWHIYAHQTSENILQLPNNKEEPAGKEQTERNKKGESNNKRVRLDAYTGPASERVPRTFHKMRREIIGKGEFRENGEQRVQTIE